MNKLLRACINYIQLTKPSIMLLVLFTGAAALVVEGSMLGEPLQFALVLLGLYLTGGSANSLNQYLEREIDARMSRTAGRRPLPRGAIKPTRALVFSIVIGVVGVLLFGLVFNWLTAALALANILFYGLFYTLYLKPNTPQNIVIGGIAGAMAPVGAWAAATGTMHIAPWIMFSIIFFWTPPHFWTLAIFCKDDYRRAGLPMMPLVRGDVSTLSQIFYYTLVLVAVSLALPFFGAGWFYLAAAVFLGMAFIKRAWDLKKSSSAEALRPMFRFSLVYLFGIFAALMLDTLV